MGLCHVTSLREDLLWVHPLLGRSQSAGHRHRSSRQEAEQVEESENDEKEHEPGTLDDHHRQCLIQRACVQAQAGSEASRVHHHCDDDSDDEDPPPAAADDVPRTEQSGEVHDAEYDLGNTGAKRRICAGSGAGDAEDEVHDRGEDQIGRAWCRERV